ncbi:unnamed protein product [Spirodela intermedia]|uniref:Uncharacterized protein n=1 Tax=Spirodela intermedia TaxID=51605 RepID=A0ABN7EA43_SPIIN|nr:unnamed protein product [Spirodela intermedia]
MHAYTHINALRSSIFQPIAFLFFRSTSNNSLFVHHSNQLQ